ncbi:MAG: isopenicillin N synthase family oxygenase [Alphaproteobacteria bacterium]|nr:isopenicillin N synthase family oxygenase [Alphaproteobacteria bacterium]
MAARALPVIDLDGAATPAAAAPRIAAEMHAACTRWGFFYIANHGVDPALQARVFDEARALFALPLEAKLAVALAKSPARRGYEPLEGQSLDPATPPDLKEGFFVGREIAADDPRTLAGRFAHGPNQWPAGLPAFRPVMETYYGVMLALTTRLLALLARSLGLDERTFEPYLVEPIANLRLLHYPPQPPSAATRQKGAGAHTDFGSTTILMQDDNPGLQVEDADTGRWIDAPPIPGTYVVNMGDMLARWTNDRYRSALHRVVNLTGRDRYTVPFFMTGNPDHVVACLAGCTAPGEAPRYPAVTVEEHFREMYRRTYGR